MATFGSLGAGLASGLEQHRQFGERQQQFEAGQTDKRVTRGIELIGQLKTLIESDPRQKALVGDMLTSTAELVSGLTENEGWNSLAAGVLSAPAKEVVGEQIIFVDQTLDPARQMSESIAVLSTDVEGLRAARSNPNLRQIEKYEIPEVTEAKVDPNRYKVVGNRIWDAVEQMFKTDAPAEKVTAAEFEQVPGVGFVHLATQKIIFGPEETVDWDRYRNVSDGIFDLQEGIWKSPPTKKYDHLRNVAGGIYDVEQLGWVVSPKKEHNVLDVQGGIFDLDARAWLVEPPEKFDHIKTVKDGIWNARVGRWEVEPSKSWSHLKVVDGGVFDPSANDGEGVWLVPKSEKGLWTYAPHPSKVNLVIAISPEGQRSVQPKASLTLAEQAVLTSQAELAGKKAVAVDEALLGEEAIIAAEEARLKTGIDRDIALREAETDVLADDIRAQGRLDRAALEGEIKAAMNVAEWDALEAEVDGLTRRDILRKKGYIKDDAERAMRAAADGYLYYVDTKERVYPDIRKDRKAYSAMVLFNPNAEEGEPRWDAFNRNEDQNTINRQIEAGWIPTSISIAAENVEGLLTDRQIVEEFKGADKAAQMMSEVSSLFEGLEKMEGGGVGLRGKATELFARGIGLFSPGMEEAIIQASTGADSQEFYGFRERIKRMANNLVTVYTGEESGRYTDIEREIAKQASSLDVITATPAAVRATLTNLFVLNMMSKMRGQYAMYRSDPTAFPFELDVLDADNLSEVATYILDSTGFRENEDDSTVTAAEIRIVNGMLKDLVSFQKIMVGR